DATALVLVDAAARNPHEADTAPILWKIQLDGGRSDLGRAMFLEHINRDHDLRRPRRRVEAHELLLLVRRIENVLEGPANTELLARGGQLNELIVHDLERRAPEHDVLAVARELAREVEVRDLSHR